MVEEKNNLRLAFKLRVLDITYFPAHMAEKDTISLHSSGLSSHELNDCGVRMNGIALDIFRI